MWRSSFAFLLRLVFVVFAVVSIVFFLQRLLPGSPVDAVLGPDALDSDKKRWLAEYGLDRSLFDQYTSYLEGLSRGDFGRRWLDGRPVWPILKARFAETLKLSLAAFAVSVCSAFLMGIWSAMKSGTRTDKVLAFVSLVFISAPTFVTGTVLLWIFAVWLDVLPLTGSSGWKSLLLPACALGMALAAITGRMLRTSILDTLDEDFIRTAKAKGVSRLQIFIRHALRNALLPTVTLFGLQLGTLLGGAVVTEQVFTWPGLGALMMEAIGQRDYNLLGGCVVILSLAHVCAGALVDVLHKMIDPRLEAA